MAAGSHATKAGTRVAANTSPEPFSNWFLSLAEDAFVIGLSFLTLKFPLHRARRQRRDPDADRRRSRDRFGGGCAREQRAGQASAIDRNREMISSGISVRLHAAVADSSRHTPPSPCRCRSRYRRASITCAHWIVLRRHRADLGLHLEFVLET